MKKKKTLTIIGVALLVILLVIGCFVGTDDKTGGTATKLSNDPQQVFTNAQNESNAVKDNEQGELTEIKIDTYLDYYNGNENKLVLIARPTCGYCQIAEPIIRKIIKDYDIEINYLNTDDLSGDDTVKFTSSDAEFSNGFGTPMLLVVGNGKIVDKVDGLTDTAHYVDFIKTNNFIK